MKKIEIWKWALLFSQFDLYDKFINIVIVFDCVHLVE
jgi:hypothetical protein